MFSSIILAVVVILASILYMFIDPTKDHRSRPMRTASGKVGVRDDGTGSDDELTTTSTRAALPSTGDAVERAVLAEAERTASSNDSLHTSPTSPYALSGSSKASSSDTPVGFSVVLERSKFLSAFYWSPHSRPKDESSPPSSYKPQDNITFARVLLTGLQTELAQEVARATAAAGGKIVVASDVILRVWGDSGGKITSVVNVTPSDDKTITWHPHPKSGFYARFPHVLAGSTAVDAVVIIELPSHVNSAPEVGAVSPLLKGDLMYLDTAADVWKRLFVIEDGQWVDALSLDAIKASFVRSVSPSIDSVLKKRITTVSRAPLEAELP